MSHHGQCECGGVSFAVNGELRNVSNCHCRRCRRFTGHHMAATGAEVSSVAITDSGVLRWYSPEPSVAYGFCGTCGASLFWKTTARPEWLSICAGALDQPTGLRTAKSWWTSEHGDYHEPEPNVEAHPHDG